MRHALSTYGLADLYRARTVRELPQAANDNHPDRITKFVVHNGGRSASSYMVPVTLARCGEGTEDDADGAAVNEYALRQVAA